MRKTIGFMCGWGCENMIQPVIENHLNICDKIYVNIQCHHPNFEKLEDSTLAVVDRLCKDESRLVLTRYDGPIRKKCGETKCAILNMMLSQSNLENGDVIMICDIDEFFDGDAIKEIKSEIEKDDWDCLSVHSRFFVVNRYWSIGGRQIRYFKYCDGTHFTPTQNINPKSKHTKNIIKNHPMFHYSMLINPDYKRAHWRCAVVDRPHMRTWLEEIYLNWDPYDHDKCKELAEKNKTVSNHFGFWQNPAMKEISQPPYIMRFDGSHPVDVTSLRLHERLLGKEPNI